LQVLLQGIHVVFHLAGGRAPQDRVLLCNRISKRTSGKGDKKQGLSRVSLHLVENVSMGFEKMTASAVKK